MVFCANNLLTTPGLALKLILVFGLGAGGCCEDNSLSCRSLKKSNRFAPCGCGVDGKSSWATGHAG